MSFITDIKISPKWFSWDAWYNWNNFTVVAFDFLWLWWAVANMYLKTDKWFVLAHKFDYAWTTTWTFMLSPNQPVRSVIRSTTWVWSFKTICSQVATEWSSEEWGKRIWIRNITAVATNTVDTSYALLWIRAGASQRDINIVHEKYWVINNTSTDAWIISIRLNPTVSWTFTYTATSRFEQAIWTSANTVTWWRVIDIAQSTTYWWWASISKNYLNSLDKQIDNTADQLVLVYTPVTANQSVYWYMNLKEF